MGFFNASMELFISLLSVAVIAAGGWLIMKDRLNYIDLITFSLYITTFISPVRKLANFAEMFSNGFAGLHRFIELMATAIRENIRVLEAERRWPSPRHLPEGPGHPHSGRGHLGTGQRHRAKIQGAFDQLSQGAPPHHCPPALHHRSAHRILVVQDGRIAEQGSHAQLLANGARPACTTRRIWGEPWRDLLDRLAANGDERLLLEGSGINTSSAAAGTSRW